LVSTDVHHYNDGTTSRDQMISAPSVAQVLEMYQAIAEIDARVAAGGELDRIASESRA
jgi:hypothetical protein